MITPMKYIDFNTWMTIIALTKSVMRTANITQIINVPKEQILPEYPRDLTKLKKPSIIIQKVADDISTPCFSNGFLGQAYDVASDTYYDVFGRRHFITLQYDVIADSNSENAIIESILTDDVLCLGGKDIMIYDFVTSLTAPPILGTAKLKHDLDIIPIDATENNNYRTTIRFYLEVLQAVIPPQEYVDLSKWIKISQRVKL